MDVQAAGRISPIRPLDDIGMAVATKSTSQDVNFATVLSDVVSGINDDMVQADQAIDDFENGKTEDLDSVVMASVKADLSFRFLIEMRNRVTQSYQELSRMQF